MIRNKNIIRSQNMAEVIKFLYNQKKAVATEISEATNISTVTVHSIIKKLLNKGIVIEGESVQKSIGRPALTYEFNFDFLTSLHLYVLQKRDAHELQIVGEVVNLAGQAKEHVIIDFTEYTLGNFLDIFNRIYQKFKEVDNIGIMLPGKVHEGIIVSSWYDKFNGWELEKSIREIVDKPLIIQNDSHIFTVGYCAANDIPVSEMVIGIYYPKNSNPGITIYSNEHLIEGQHSLAGEGKFFPDFTVKGDAQTPEEIVSYLNNILPFYNVALAPHRIVLTANYKLSDEMLKQIFENTIYQKQLNKPRFEFTDEFHSMCRLGLQKLIYNDTPVV